MKQQKIILLFNYFCMTIFCASLSYESFLFSTTIEYEQFDYSDLFHKILNDNHSQMYKINIKDVDKYLKYEQSIKKNSVKLLDERLLPIKGVVKVMYRGFHKKNQLFSAPYSFFRSLSEGVPYTYVIKDNRFIMTQSTHLPQSEKWRNRFSKHYFISGLKNHVRYAGEFYIVKNINNNQIIVVLDNASGTFCPESDYLPKVKELMLHNFFQENLHFMVKKHDEKIDHQEIVKHFQSASQQSL